MIYLYSIDIILFDNQSIIFFISQYSIVCCSSALYSPVCQYQLIFKFQFQIYQGLQVILFRQFLSFVQLRIILPLICQFPTFTINITNIETLQLFDDAISYVISLSTFVPIIIQLQILIRKMLTFISIFFLLFQSYHQQLLSLIRFAEEITDDCWILDTNNLTEIGMGNCQNQLYFLNLGLGTPPSFFNFQIDTFRDSIWFPFNQTYVNNSETFQITNKTAITYLHKSLYQGSVGSDIITILQTNISTRSSVIWANKSMDLPSYPVIDGLLGLGYSSTPNFLDNAAMNNQINSSIFALQMGGEGQPSVLYYSQLPSFLLDSTINVPVVGDLLWQVDIQSVRVQGFQYSGIVSKTMIIDTNTGLMYLNPTFYKKLTAKFFNSCASTAEQGLLCQCNQNWPELEFILQSVSISIAPDAYFKREQHGCLLLIGQTLSEDSPVLMGGSLLKNYIITFDKQNKQLGFNGTSLGKWPYLFLIFQLIMIACALVAIGVAVYLVMTIRFIKMEKLQKKQKKGKKYKDKNGNQRLLQLTSQFIDP